MPKRYPLQGETVIFTGTLKSPDALELVKEYGGNPHSLPLIQVNEIEQPTDKMRLLEAAQYDWLIFTSQNAVHVFHEKMLRHAIKPEQIPCEIAAVGSQTASALEKIGFTVSFIPTTFSADVFVQQFKPEGTNLLKVLFLRGSLAGSIIREKLPFQVEEWTVYETGAKPASIISIVELLKTEKHCTILFASPSAVHVYEQGAAPIIGWEGFTIGAIGHVTEKALLAAGATVHVKPETYTLKELVNALARRKEVIQ